MRGERRKGLSPSPKLPRRSMVEVNPPASFCDSVLRIFPRHAPTNTGFNGGYIGHHGHKFHDQSASRRIEANFKDFMWLSSWPSLSPPFIPLALTLSNYFRSLNTIFSFTVRPFPFTFIAHCLTFSSSTILSCIFLHRLYFLHYLWNARRLFLSRFGRTQRVGPALYRIRLGDKSSKF